MSMEFEKVTLIWSQRYVGHLLANPKEEFCDIIDGFLAVYLEGFISWIPSDALSELDTLKYQRLSDCPLLGFKEPTDLVMDHLEKLGISSSGDEDYLVEDPASYPNIDIGIIYIKQIQTVSIELFISDDLSEAFPLIDIAYEFSKGNIEHESYIMKHGNPVAFVESIGCHVKIKRKEQTYTLMHKLDSGSTKSSIFSFNHTQNSVIQNLFRRRSFEWSDDSLEDSASKFAWATLGLFSNLTRLSREAFFESANDLRRPDKFSLNYIETFTNMRIPKDSIPQKPAWDSTPICLSDLKKLEIFARGQYLDHLKPLVFSKGISESLRPLLWPILLEIPEWNFDVKNNEIIMESLSVSYESIKAQWDGAGMNQADSKTLELRKSRIIKDVLRTDRNVAFYQKSPDQSKEALELADLEAKIDNENTRMLKDILISYCYYNPSLEYVQGMSDLLSPLLYVVQNEALAFWMFVNYMNTMERNFHEGGEEIKGSLKRLEKLVRLLIPDLYSFLSRKGVLHFFFCYRWVLIRFKREFSFEDILQLWERLWTHFPGTHFWIFICLGILQQYKDEIMKLIEFEDILQFVNQLAGKMDLQAIVIRAEDLYYRFSYLCQFIDDEDLHAISSSES